MSALLAEPYGLDPEFEQCVLFYCASSRKFWECVGYALQSDCLGSPYARIILEVCREAHKIHSSSHASLLLSVHNGLIHKIDEGRYPADILHAAIAYLAGGKDHPHRPDFDTTIGTLVPIIRKRMQQGAVMQSMAELQKAGDFAGVVQALEKAAKFGLSIETPSARLGPQAFQEIADSKFYHRMATGIPDLDAQMRGIPRKSLGVWVAASGGGKSMNLVQCAAEAIHAQLFVGFVTLELPKYMQFARLVANLTGVSINDILEDTDGGLAESQRRLGQMLPSLGICEVQEFQPHMTTTRDITEWIDQVEQINGTKMGMLVVDYADKLYEPRVKDNNDYLMMRYVYEGLRRDIAVERDMWVWTASQASRTAQGKAAPRYLDMNNLADSIQKARVADVVISLNQEGDNQHMINYFVAKNRIGEARFSVGPCPTDYARARPVAKLREWTDWSKY